MSQHDYAIADQAGVSFLSDLNAALVAQVGNNSGATAPATTYAYMLWADSTTGWLKQRNAANSAWVYVMPLAGHAEASLASATTTDLGAQVSDLVLVSGTTTITGFGTADAGRVVLVRHSGALTLTHNGTSLILPGAANITTAVGDTYEAESLGSGNWVVRAYQKASGAAVTRKAIQQVNAQSGAVATGSTVIPLDDTIPQNTEGNEYITCAITPASATNVLEITAVIIMATTAVGANALIAALFQDSTAGALAASVQYVPAANAPATVVLKHRMVAGTTSATTFKIRGGCNSAGTTTFNGYSSGRSFGGVMASSLTITELTP